MTNLNLTVTSSELQRALRGVSRYLSDLEPAYKASGEYLMRKTRHRFDTETDPSGRKWTPLKASTIRRKERLSSGRQGKGRKQVKAKAPAIAILRETNALRDTIEYQTTADSLRVGTPQRYGIYHQFGASRMAAREFLGVDAADESMVLDIFSAHIQKARN